MLHGILATTKTIIYLWKPLTIIVSGFNIKRRVKWDSCHDRRWYWHRSITEMPSTIISGVSIKKKTLYETPVKTVSGFGRLQEKGKSFNETLVKTVSGFGRL